MSVVPNQKEILANAHDIVKGLEKLRSEQEKLLNKIDQQDDESDRADLLTRNIERINVGLDESRSMFLIASHLSFIAIERQSLKDLSKKLDGENTWLTDELMHTRKQLKSSEARVIELEEDVKKLEFEIGLLKNQLKSDEEESFETTEESDQVPSVDSMSSRDTSSPMICEASAGCKLSISHQFLCRQVAHYVGQGKHECATTLCKQVIKDLERCSGHYHPDVATLLNILALVYREQKMFQESEDLLKDALRIREKTLGEDHPAVATTINNLAVLYEKQCKPEEAEALSERSLQLREQALGPHHTDLIKYLKTLGLLYQNHCKYNDALVCYHRALKIYQTNNLPEDKNSKEMKIWAAHCYMKQQSFQDIGDNLDNNTQRTRSGTMASTPSPRAKPNLALGHRRYSISSPNGAEFNQISRDREARVVVPKQEGIRKSFSKKKINYILGVDAQ